MAFSGILFDSISEYEVEIADVRLAISRINALGQKTSNSSGGSDRSNEDAELKQLIAYLVMLRKELLSLKGKPPLVLGIGW